MKGEDVDDHGRQPVLASAVAKSSAPAGMGSDGGGGKFNKPFRLHTKKTSPSEALATVRTRRAACRVWGS